MKLTPQAIASIENADHGPEIIVMPDGSCVPVEAGSGSLNPSGHNVSSEIAKIRELVEVSDGEIVIRIPIEILPNAASIAWDRRSTRRIVVTDSWAFASGLMNVLRREAENGDTPVTDMLDAAVTRAIENGVIGFEFEDEQ